MIISIVKMKKIWNYKKKLTSFLRKVVEKTILTVQYHCAQHSMNRNIDLQNTLKEKARDSINAKVIKTNISNTWERKNKRVKRDNSKEKSMNWKKKLENSKIQIKSYKKHYPSRKNK